MYQVSEINGVRIYNLSAGKSTNEFYEESKKTHKSLRYNEDFRRRIQLIQEFSFEIASTQVSFTPDERYIIATGIYKPQLKIFDTQELSLKCMRGLDSSVVKFAILSEDYSKIVMAQEDRTLDFHAQYGAHYKTRVPHCPRDLIFNPYAAELCISVSAPYVYRMSLELGKFLQPLQVSSSINSLDFNLQLSLLACGGQTVELWDPRANHAALAIRDVAKETLALKWDPTGLQLGVGEGSTFCLYDVRYSGKVMSSRCSYNESINCIKFLYSNAVESNSLENPKKYIAFSNKEQIKIISSNGVGQYFTSIEPGASIHNFTRAEKSGLLLAALDQPKMGIFFINQLGPAPSWAPYIQNITQQLEQSTSKYVYENYQFLSKEQFEQMDCFHLLNTNLIKPYMHGYLIHLKLYNKILSEKESLLDYNEWRAKQQEKETERRKKKAIQQSTDKEKQDDRFKVDKGNKDFEIDVLDDAYLLRHSHLKSSILKQRDSKRKALEKALKIKHKHIEKKRIVHR